MSQNLKPKLFAVALLVTTSAALGHGGGTDAHGCHNDTSIGEYHCHSGPYDGQTFDSEAEMLKRTGAGRDASRPKSHSQNSQVRSNGSSGGGYDRDDYHSSWVDHDRDCQDVREEVLIEESQIPVQFETSRECNVIAGRWQDPYSGKTFADPGELHIDHLVPLKEVHVSGGSGWQRQRRHRYANDLSSDNTLIAVSASENMSKSAKDPAEWMPAKDSYHCEYIESWVQVKSRWNLRMDYRERQHVEQMQAECN